MVRIGWLEKLYLKLHFQKTYDCIKSWSLTPQQEILLDTIWQDLEPQLKKALWAFIVMIFNKYGESAAKDVLGNVLAQVKKSGWVVEA